MERAAFAVLDAAWARAACATSTRRAPTGGRRRSWVRWLAARAVAPRRRRRRARSGATVHGDWRVDARTHEIKELSARPAAAPVGASRARCSATTSRSTRSTRRRWRAGCSTTRGARRARGARGGGRADRPLGDRAGAGGDDRARAGGRGFDAVQATWNLHERSAGGRARRGARRRPDRVRQGGAGERPADRARRRPRCPRPRASAASTEDEIALARGARAAVGGCRAERRGDGEQLESNLGAASGRGTPSWSRHARGVAEDAEALLVDARGVDVDAEVSCQRQQQGEAGQA